MFAVGLNSAVKARPRATVAERKLFDDAVKEVENLQRDIRTCNRAVDALRKELELSRLRNHQLQAETSEWKETAVTFIRGQEFYHDIVRECGEQLGGACYVSDDGIVQDDVLAFRVPEILAERLAKRPNIFLRAIAIFSHR